MLMFREIGVFVLAWMGVFMLMPVLCCAEGTDDGSGAKAEILSATRIWDQGQHNAFTGLIRHEDRWYCVFREGEGHVCAHGALRVLVSEDGHAWESMALLASDKADLRDAQICVTPEGELMLSGAAALHDRSVFSHQSMAWFSRDGRTWSQPVDIGDPNFWLWRVTWHKGVAYAIGYSVSPERKIRLYTSQDGRKFDVLVENMLDREYPNETSLVFLENDQGICLLRRGGTGMVGLAEPPYKEWEWKDLGVEIGGPHCIQLPDGRFIAGVRLYDNKVRTSLCWLDPHQGKLQEFLSLPSGGDTSYPGLVWHENVLWVSYYSSHEGKTSIYLARVKLP